MGDSKIHELVGRVTSDVTRFVTGMNSVISKTKDVGKAWIKAGADVAKSAAKITAAVTAVAAVSFAAAKKFADAAQAQVDEERKLAAVLKATGNAAKLSAEQIREFAAARQLITNFGDEVTLQGAAILATFKQIQGDAFLRTLAVAQDVSSVLGTDLKSSVLQLGKAINDPLIGLTMLQRVGISFTKTQQEQIKGLVKSGQLLKAQGLILAEVESQFGGAAEALANPMAQLRNMLGDVAENIGFAVLPAFRMLSEMVQEFVGPLQQNREQFEALGERVRVWIESYKPQILQTVSDLVQELTTKGRELLDWAIEMGPAILEVAQTVGRWVAAIVKYMGEHPKFFAALVAIKVAGILGITTALGSLVTAITTTVSVLTGSLIPALAALGPAGWVILGVTAIVAAVVAFREEIAGLFSDLSEQEKIGEDLDRQLADLKERRRRKAEAEGGGAAAATDPAAAAGAVDAEASAPTTAGGLLSSFAGAVGKGTDQVAGLALSAGAFAKGQSDDRQSDLAAQVTSVEPMLAQFVGTLESLGNAGSLAGEQMQTLETQAAILRDQLASGAISVSEFKDGMRGLEQATDDAVAATEKKLQKEREEALLKGDFEGAGLDPKEALREKLIAARMAQFNAGVQKAADAITGTNDSVNKLNEGLDDTTKELRDNTSAVAKGGSGAGSEQLSGLLSFLASPAGEAATILNEISQLQQAVNFLSSGYNPAGFTRVQSFLDEIARLQGRLNELASTPPVFAAVSFGDVLEEQFNDQSLTSPGNAGTSITINARSVHRDEIGPIVDRAAQVTRQRGRFLA